MLLAPKLGGSPSPTRAERIFERRRGVVRDDGLGAFFGRGFSEWSASKAASAMIGRMLRRALVGGIALAEQTGWAAQSAHSQVDLGAQAASRASDGPIFSPPLHRWRAGERRGQPWSCTIRYSVGGRKARHYTEPKHAARERQIRSKELIHSSRCYKIYATEMLQNNLNEPHIKSLILIKILEWCGREDSNLHGLPR